MFSHELYLFIEPAVPEVIVEGHNRSHSTVVTVSWEPPRQWSSQHWQNLSSFTVFWCRGSRISASCQVNNGCLQNKMYRKVPKFSDARKLCCNLPKIQTKRPNLRVFCQNDANGIANSEDDLGLHCLPRPICPKT